MQWYNVLRGNEICGDRFRFVQIVQHGGKGFRHNLGEVDATLAILRVGLIGLRFMSMKARDKVQTTAVSVGQDTAMRVVGRDFAFQRVETTSGTGKHMSHGIMGTLDGDFQNAIAKALLGIDPPMDPITTSIFYSESTWGWV